MSADWSLPASTEDEAANEARIFASFRQESETARDAYYAAREVWRGKGSPSGSLSDLVEDLRQWMWSTKVHAARDERVGREDVS